LKIQRQSFHPTPVFSSNASLFTQCHSFKRLPLQFCLISIANQPAVTFSEPLPNRCSRFSLDPRAGFAMLTAEKTMTYHLKCMVIGVFRSISKKERI